MEGAVALAESIFQTSVRLGIPEKFNGMEAVLKNPIYATALGLVGFGFDQIKQGYTFCLLYTSPSPRDQRGSRMPSSA